jgi:hypothetical protein
MPVATGSIAFLGAARFQGSWDASRNDGTGSGLPSAADGEFADLFNATVSGGGYHASTDLTASNGDYWQVHVAGTTTVNGNSSWAVNDWLIYSGSQWVKLGFTNTISSIVLGNLNGGTDSLTQALLGDFQNINTIGKGQKSTSISTDLTIPSNTVIEFVHAGIHDPTGSENDNIDIAEGKTLNIPQGSAVAVRSLKR